MFAKIDKVIRPTVLAPLVSAEGRVYDVIALYSHVEDHAQALDSMNSTQKSHALSLTDLSETQKQHADAHFDLAVRSGGAIQDLQAASASLGEAVQVLQAAVVELQKPWWKRFAARLHRIFGGNNG